MDQGKLYYSIGEVAKIFNVNASLIRFWEKEFTSLHPKKNTKGNRKFTSQDIQEIKSIYELVKVKGFTLEGAKKALKKGSLETPENRNEAIIQKLIKIKTELQTLI